VTDADGEMRAIRSDNILLASVEPSYISVRGVQIYEPGSKDFDSFFTARLTFRNGVVQTIYVSDDYRTIYVESSDMGFALEYTALGDVRHIAQGMQQMIDGSPFPRTG
jgi:hypothetical protein